MERRDDHDSVAVVVLAGAREAWRVAKYDPLFEHLCKAGDGPLEMSFEAVAALVGGLPKSAYTYPAWWANETVGNHVEARAWMNAGRLVERVDLNRQVVWFSAAGWHRGS